MDQIARPPDGHVAAAGVAVGRGQRVRAQAALLLVVLAALLTALGYWYVTRNEVTTDDAFTDGHAITVAPQVGGTVVALDVHDNQFVHAGQMLAEIDPRADRAARDATAASLAQARALRDAARVALERVRIAAPARLAAARATLAVAQAKLTRADADWRRQLHLPRQATTQQAIDNATAAHLAALAGVAAAQAALRGADTVPEAIAAAEAVLAQRTAEVALARARLATAALDLSWTRILAPSAGWVTRRSVELGNEVRPGQALFALVRPKLWVTANLKETDLDRVRPGELVSIAVDAYPELHLKGHVDSIQRGTGGRFSTFPAENATGNFVKVVQRVPVKIAIDSGLDPKLALPLGLSVEPTIHLK